MLLRRTRIHLLLLILSSLVFLLVLVCFGAYGMVSRQLYASLKQDLLLAAHAVTFSVEHENSQFDFSESIYLASRPLDIDMDEFGTAEWLDAQGNLVAHRGRLPVPRQGLEPDRLILGKESCSYTLAAAENGRIYGYARVALPLEPLQRQLTELIYLLISIGVSTLVLAAGLGWRWTGLCLKPLQQAYDELELFTGAVSHELRSPLTAMLTQCQSLLRHYDRLEPEEIRESLRELSQSSEDMSRLVNDLLMLAQIRRKRTDLNLETESLSEVVQSVCSQMGTRAERIHCQTSGEKVIAHLPYLKLILRNLLENALNYSETGSPVQVSWVEDQAALEIVVSDQGVGLSEEDSVRVFDPFWRADRSRARQAGGAGLGLAIARSLAEAMNGRLSVKSKLGKGSQFRLILPLRAAWKGRTRAGGGWREAP